MATRVVASVVAFALSVWAAAPRFAQVDCRPGFARCEKCPRPKLLPGASLKADCCIEHSAVERAQVIPAHPHPELSAVLPLALDQGQLAHRPSLGWVVTGFTADPSPPPLHRLRPLLS